jgi:hypothetical protein
MSIYPEYNQENREKLYHIQNIKIGLFGSFRQPRLSYLENLKKHLKDSGYFNTFDARDFPQGTHKSKDEKYEHALENSYRALDISDIRIFFLYCEMIGEHGINESSAIEINEVFRRNCEDGIILIIEDGVVEQIRANLKGILVKGKKKRWVTIRLDPILSSHEDIVESACYNYIGRMLQKRRESSFLR